MEKFKNLIWLAALLIIVCAYYFHEIPVHERSTAYKVFGDYNFPAAKLSLALNTNQWYKLKKDKRFLSEGIFEVKGDTIVLTDDRTDRKMYLLYESEEKLIALKVDSVPEGSKLLCWLKTYPDGEVKFTGIWKGGEKHGVWLHFDEHKNRIQTTLFEKGKVVQENYKYEFEGADSIGRNSR